MKPFKDEQFGIVYKRVMCESGLSIGSKALYAYLSCFANEDGECFPSNSRICNDLGKSRQSIEKYLEELYAKGYLGYNQEREGNRYGKRIIYFCSPEYWGK